MSGSHLSCSLICSRPSLFFFALRSPWSVLWQGSLWPDDTNFPPVMAFQSAKNDLQHEMVVISSSNHQCYFFQQCMVQISSEAECSSATYLQTVSSSLKCWWVLHRDVIWFSACSILLDIRFSLFAEFSGYWMLASAHWLVMVIHTDISLVGCASAGVRAWKRISSWWLQLPSTMGLLVDLNFFGVSVLKITIITHHPQPPEYFILGVWCRLPFWVS